MKKILYTSLVVFMFIFMIPRVNADTISIVSSHNKEEKFDYIGVTNTINETKSDFKNGKLVVDLTIDSRQTTEVVYVFDGSSNMADAQEELFKSLSAVAKKNEEYSSKNGNYISLGAVTVKDGVASSEPLKLTGIEESLNNIKSKGLSSDADAEIEIAMKEAKKLYSGNAELQIMVLFVSSLPSSTESLEALVSEYASSNIELIVYGIKKPAEETINKETFNKVFANAYYSLFEDYNFEFGMIGMPLQMLSINYLEPTKFSGQISFNSDILNNFEISYITTDYGVAFLDGNSIKWETDFSSYNEGYKENIIANNLINLSYTLTLKEDFDKNIIGKNINLNNQVVLKGTKRNLFTSAPSVITGTYPSNPDTDDPCSPVIKINKIADNPENPDTGLNNYAIFGSILIIGSIIGILLLNKRKVTR